jgi:hypothetical protein
METLKAEVAQQDDSRFIQITKDDAEIKIPLTEDNPNAVKSAFNELITLAKQDDLEIEMDEVGPDLYSQVAREYIAQLNREIQEVRREMQDIGLSDDVN